MILPETPLHSKEKHKTFTLAICLWPEVTAQKYFAVYNFKKEVHMELIV